MSKTLDEMKIEYAKELRNDLGTMIDGCLHHTKIDSRDREFLIDILVAYLKQRDYRVVGLDDEVDRIWDQIQFHYYRKEDLKADLSRIVEEARKRA
jgi:DNA-binding transcriptional regulator/RsmH inhibitor MraZ